MIRVALFFLAGLAIAGSHAREVPKNLKALYNQASAQGQCNNALATGFYSWPSSSNGTPVCICGGEWLIRFARPT